MLNKNIDKVEELIKRLRLLQGFIESQSNYDAKIFINGYSCHNSNQGRAIDIKYILRDNDLKQKIIESVKNEIADIGDEIRNLE